MRRDITRLPVFTERKDMLDKYLTSSKFMSFFVFLNTVLLPAAYAQTAFTSGFVCKFVKWVNDEVIISIAFVAFIISIISLFTDDMKIPKWFSWVLIVLSLAAFAPGLFGMLPRGQQFMQTCGLS